MPSHSYFFEGIHAQANQKHPQHKSKALGFNLHVHAAYFAHLPGQLQGHVADHIATWTPRRNVQKIHCTPFLRTTAIERSTEKNVKKHQPCLGHPILRLSCLDRDKNSRVSISSKGHSCDKSTSSKSGFSGSGTKRKQPGPPIHMVFCRDRRNFTSLVV